MSGNISSNPNLSSTPNQPVVNSGATRTPGIVTTAQDRKYEERARYGIPTQRVTYYDDD